MNAKKFAWACLLSTAHAEPYWFYYAYWFYCGIFFECDEKKTLDGLQIHSTLILKSKENTKR